MWTKEAVAAAKDRETQMDEIESFTFPSGKLGMMAKRAGAFVCAQCMRPYDDRDGGSLLEICPHGGDTPTGIHTRCFDTVRRGGHNPLVKNSLGLRTQRQMANALRGVKKIFG